MKILLYKYQESEPFKKYDDPKQVKICADNKLVKIYNYPDGKLDGQYPLISKKLDWVKILDEEEVLVVLNVESEEVEDDNSK